MTQTTGSNYFQVRNIMEVLQDGLNAKPQGKICGPFLLEDTTHYLFSRTNYGKSLMVFQLAYAAATGTSIADCHALRNECPPMKVLVVDLELEARDLAKRHGKVLSQMKYEHCGNLLYLHEKIEEKMAVGFQLLSKIENAAIEHNARLVIIDNISKLIPDLLKPELVTMVITSLNRIRIKTSAAILIIGHTTKGNPRTCIQPTDFYGSSCLQNFFFHVSYLDTTKDGRFFLCNSKGKDEECYDRTVPVFTRGEHATVGVGFTYETMQDLADIQLPFTLKPAQNTRRRNLAQYRKEIGMLIQSGVKYNTIAGLCGVDRSTIYRLLET